MLRIREKFLSCAASALRSQEYAQVVPQRDIDLAGILTEFRRIASSEQNAHPPSATALNPGTPKHAVYLQQSSGKRSTTASPKCMQIPKFSPPVTPANAHFSSMSRTVPWITAHFSPQNRLIEGWRQCVSRIQLTSCS